MADNQILKNIVDQLINNGVIENVNDLAKKLGMHSANLYRIYRGERNIPASLKMLLMEEFKVAKNYLNTGKPPMFSVDSSKADIIKNIVTGKQLQKIVWESGIKIADIVNQSGIKEPTFYSLYKKPIVDEYYIMKLLKTDLKPYFKNFNIQENENLSVNVAEQDNVHNVITPQNQTLKNLIIVPLKAFGGFLTGYSNKVYMDSLEKIYFPWIKGECYAFQVDGYSMFLTHKMNGKLLKEGYEPGSYVITTSVESPQWLTKGKDYVFVTTEGIILKRFNKIENGTLHLECINPEFNNKTLSVNTVKKIFYVEDTANNKPQ